MVTTDEVRKKRVGKACDSCRMKKTKCDGRRPCLRCSQDDKLCTYSEKRRQQEKTYSASYVELLEIRVEMLQEGLQKVITKLSRGEDVSSFIPANNDFSINGIIELLKENNIIGSGAAGMVSGMYSQTTPSPSDTIEENEVWPSQSHGTQGQGASHTRSQSQNAFGSMNNASSHFRTSSVAPRSHSTMAFSGQGHNRSSSAGPGRRGLSQFGNNEHTRGRQRVDYYESDMNSGDSDGENEESFPKSTDVDEIDHDQELATVGGLGLGGSPSQQQSHLNRSVSSQSQNQMSSTNFEPTPDAYSPVFKVSPFSDQTGNTSPPSASGAGDYGNSPPSKIRVDGLAGEEINPAYQQQPSYGQQQSIQQHQLQHGGTLSPVSSGLTNESSLSGQHFGSAGASSMPSSYMPQYDTRQSFDGMMPPSSMQNHTSMGDGEIQGAAQAQGLSQGQEPQFMYNQSQHNSMVGGSGSGPADNTSVPSHADASDFAGPSSFQMAPPSLGGTTSVSDEPSSVMIPSDIDGVGFQNPDANSVAAAVADIHTTPMPYDYERTDFGINMGMNLQHGMGMDLLSLGPYKSAASLATAAIAGDYDPSDLISRSRRGSDVQSPWNTVSPSELMNPAGMSPASTVATGILNPEPLDLAGGVGHASQSRKSSFGAISRGMDDLTLSGPASPANSTSTILASNSSSTGNSSVCSSAGKIHKRSHSPHHHHHFHSGTPTSGSAPYYYQRGESASRRRDRSRSKAATVRSPRATVGGVETNDDRGRSSSKPPFGLWRQAEEEAILH